MRRLLTLAILLAGCAHRSATSLAEGEPIWLSDVPKPVAGQKAAITRPEPDHCASLQMPEEARKSGIKGRVFLKYVVHSDGTVDPGKFHVIVSAPSVLVDATERWLLGCRFKPAMQDGRPIAVALIQPFNFRFDVDEITAVDVTKADTRPSRTPSCATELAKPEEARAAGLTGRVRVEYIVHSDGSVRREEITPLAASKEGFSVLFDAVRDWLVRCKFNPAAKDGKPVAVRVTQQFDFK